MSVRGNGPSESKAWRWPPRRSLIRAAVAGGVTIIVASVVAAALDIGIGAGAGAAGGVVSALVLMRDQRT